MTKRLIDLDDQLVEHAQEVSGQPTLKATVSLALEMLVTEHSRREASLRAQWATLDESLLANLHDPDIERQAWS